VGRCCPKLRSIMCLTPNRFVASRLANVSCLDARCMPLTRGLKNVRGHVALM
jgi:hypothetical protein